MTSCEDDDNEDWVKDFELKHGDVRWLQPKEKHAARQSPDMNQPALFEEVLNKHLKDDVLLLFAHGFCVLSDWVDLHYKVSRLYDPHDECGLIWNDSEVNITWPNIVTSINKRDTTYSSLSHLIENNQLPNYPPLEHQ